MGNAVRFAAFLIVLCFAAFFRPTAAPAAQAVDIELALGVDVSGSIDESEAALQRNGYIAAFRDPAVIKAITGGYMRRIAVAYFEWAGFGHHRIIVDWTVIHDASSAHAFADALTRNGPQTAARTAIGDAINFAVPFFDRNDVQGTRRVVDISGDGPNNWGAGVAEARDAAVAAGVTINGLPIVNDRASPFGWPQIPNLDLYYRDCVIGGTGAFYVVANGFQSFATAIRKKLILEIAGRTPSIRFAQVRALRDGPPLSEGSLLRANGGGSQIPFVLRSDAKHRVSKDMPQTRTWPRLLRVQAQPQRVAPSCDVGRRRWRDLEDN